MITLQLRDPRKWARSGPSLRKSGEALRTITRDVVRRAVGEGAEALRGAITGADPRIKLRLRRLDAAWVARKGTDKPLFNEGVYAGSIVARHSGASSTLTAEGLHSKGLKNAALARLLEYGTRRMEPLQHWEAAKQFIAGNIRGRFRMEVRRVIRFG